VARGAHINTQYSFVFKPSGLRDNLNKRSERQLCSLSVRWLTAYSEGRLKVAMTNKLFSFSESGHGFVWEACCPEHECQCPGQTLWLYTCEACCPEHECQCPGHTVWLYTCCISRTIQWISTRVFMPEWSSLTNIGGRISICPYHYLELKSGLIVRLKETNCCVRLDKHMFESATWRKRFYVWVSVQI
jgi:hypothetical protein